jgi:hypothetical protein
MQQQTSWLLTALVLHHVQPIVIQGLSTTSIENRPLSPFNKQCNGRFNISFSPFFLSHVLFIVIGCEIKILKRRHKLRM